MKTGVLHHVQGSAYVERDGCKVLSWVVGPREIPKKTGFSLRGVLVCNVKFAPMSFEQYPSLATDKEEAEYGVMITEALDAAVCLDRLPKSQVDVCILVLEHSPAALANALTCASMALVDANIPMYDIIVGASLEEHSASVAVSKPTQTDHVSALATLGYMPSLQQVCAFLHEGLKTDENLPNTVDNLVHQSSSLYSFVKEHLLSDVLKTTN